jgi:hypothetical protein
METKQKKRFFAKHAKSSAAVVSLAIHALLVVVALSFVAVTVIQKEEKVFESKAVKRPKMPIKKLQVPVNIKKKQVNKPKLRKRIVVQPKVNQTMPDIKMPEITGVKGGMGGGEAGGLGGAGGVGFTMPEIEVFGIKGKGEKVFIILDSSPEMMYDEMGGIPAYTIIKQELVRILGSLPPTALFNIIVYDPGRSFMLFPNMVSASSANVAKVDEWLKPLNATRPGMGAKEYGVSTLGSGGIQNNEDFLRGIFKNQREWYRPTMMAMKQQADAVFLLTCWWGNQWFYKDEVDRSWDQSSAGRRWFESYEKAKALLAKENKERAAKGQAPRVIRDTPWEMNRVYFPDIEFPPRPEAYHYQSRDYIPVMLEIRNENRPEALQTKSGLRKTPSKTKADFSFNVVHFREVGESRDTGRHETTEERFKELTSKLNGQYTMIAGLEAIKSSISQPE